MNKLYHWSTLQCMPSLLLPLNSTSNPHFNYSYSSDQLAVFAQHLSFYLKLNSVKLHLLWYWQEFAREKIFLTLNRVTLAAHCIRNCNNCTIYNLSEVALDWMVIFESKLIFWKLVTLQVYYFKIWNNIKWSAHTLLVCKPQNWVIRK